MRERCSARFDAGRLETRAVLERGASVVIISPMTSFYYTTLCGHSRHSRKRKNISGENSSKKRTYGTSQSRPGLQSLSGIREN